LPSKTGFAVYTVSGVAETAGVGATGVGAAFAAGADAGAEDALCSPLVVFLLK